MKKKFVEPKMSRIELNLKENIANSVTTDGYCVHGNDFVLFCSVHDTGMNIEELIMAGKSYLLSTCQAAPGLHENGTIVPEEVVMRYIGR